MIKNLFGYKRVSLLMLFFTGLSIMSCVIIDFFVELDSSKFPDDPRIDRSFITGQPCEAPCWYGLEVGKSNLEDIRKTLPELPFAATDKIHEQPTGDFGPNEKWFTIPCIYSKELESCAEIETSSDGTLGRVIINIDYDLSLGSVIQEIGNPEYYISDPLPDQDICLLGIYWPEKNIAAVVLQGPRSKYCTNNNSEKIDLMFQIESLVYTEIDIDNHSSDVRRPWMDFPP